MRRFVETEGRSSLRERLKAEAIANADLDLAMAAEWFPLEQEALETFERAGGKPVSKKVRSRRT